jgi:tRNA-2-methylthio-N6-dimethylallyladenosine synthase
MTGRTWCDRIVVFDAARRLAGRILPVVIYDSAPHTLFGELVLEPAAPEVYQLG